MLSPKQARVIDPVLTQVAQGYRNMTHVGPVLFPTVEVEARGGQVLEFGKEAFRTMNARRAPGSDTKTVSFGYVGKPFQLVQDALNSPVPRELMEDASNVPGVDLGTRATNAVMNILTLNLEVEQAELATNPASYDVNHKMAVAGTDQWSDPASDPMQQIDDGKDAVRATAGVEPNRMVISKPTFNALKRHPKIIERFKYTTADSITVKMLANIFELDTLAVGMASVLQSADDNAPFVDVWGNEAVLAYVPDNPAGREEPSYGYTYTLKGHPFVETADWDNNRKSWVYGVTYERAPVTTGILSGFLFQNVVAQ
ncbi:MAG TPA: hypothetical protein ENH55_19820 [Aurantimonas coralicida]|uniref:Capsid protein n=2 Tax=root TaxID=1 RepID=A0A9C9NE78_9HYPH|nr:hypothetical protein [Aurantimonas coralicida]HET99498.1 hypothetical protein [Aurantimonas coralicida]